MEHSRDCARQKAIRQLMTSDQNSWNLTIGIATLPIVSVPCVASEKVSVIGLAEDSLCALYVPSGLVNCGPPAYTSHVAVNEVDDVRFPVARYQTGFPASSYTYATMNTLEP